jgi:hypothetical protein
MEIPGHSKLPQSPEDWPEQLCRGSLNVLIHPDGHPPEFSLVAKLDDGQFKPAFEIEWHQIIGNTLYPFTGMPHHGNAQVWRAEIGRADQPSNLISCWVLRRFGSTVGEQLEIVSKDRLDPGLPNRAEVVVQMYGCWLSPLTPNNR